MKQSLRVLVLIITLLGSFMLIGCLGGSESASLIGAEREAALDSGGVVKTHALVNIDSLGIHTHTLKSVAYMSPIDGKSTVYLYGDTALKTMRVSASIDTFSFGTSYLYIWIEGRFGAATSTSEPPLDQGVPSYAKVSPEGSHFKYVLMHSTNERKGSDLLGTTGILVGGIVRETTVSRHLSSWEENGKSVSGWSVSIRVSFTPTVTPPLPVCCSEKG